MKLSFAVVALLATGLLLMYSAIHDIDPRDVVLSVVGKDGKYGSLSDPGVIGSLGNIPLHTPDGDPAGGGRPPMAQGPAHVGNIYPIIPTV